MGVGRSDIEHASTGEGGAVMDGLHFRNRTLSVMERICPGPQEQHKLLYGPGVPTQHHLERAPKITWLAHTYPSTTLHVDDKI